MKHHQNNHFNLLRLIFASLVIVAHGPELVDGNRDRELLTRIFGTYSFGEFSVNSFFILSGYLIASSWRSDPNWGTYLRKRWLRIAPGFLVTVLICMTVLGPLGAQGSPFYAAFSPVPFFAKLGILIFDYPGFPGHPYELVNGALWTIHYEFVCYLLLGVLGSLGWLARPRWIIGLFCVCIALYSLNIHLEPLYKTLGRSPGRTLWFIMGNHVRFMSFFLAGVIFHLYRARITLRHDIALAAAAAFALLMHHAQTAPFAMAIPWTYLIFWMGTRNLHGLAIFQRTDISYGVYLYAWPIQQLVIQHVSRDLGIVIGLTTVLSLVAGALSWFLVEKPMLGFKPARAAARPAMP